MAPVVVGIGLALAVGTFAALARFDRERSFYPTVLIVTASYYALFAVLGADPAALGWETGGFLLFGAAAVVGFRRNLWIVVAALCGHAVFDAVHGRLIANAGMPLWWPAFCLSFDLAAAAYLATRIATSVSGQESKLTPGDEFPPTRHLLMKRDWIMPLMFRPIDLDRDGALLIDYAKDLFAISFGSATRFVEQFGEDGSAYIRWIADKQAVTPANAALVVLRRAPVGMVVVGAWPDDPEVGYVFHYYLEPHARGLGLAPELDAYAVSALSGAGHREARLSVAQTNARALRFYSKRAWTEAGPRPDQPGILYMQRTLHADAPLTI